MQSKTTKPGFFAAFTAHPAEVGESYLEHLAFALRFSTRLFRAGAAALLHALIPALCETTASDEIKALHAELTARKTGTQ